MKTPKTFRLHIGIFGRRNVGKSSLLNTLTRQETSIVSPTPGTTTDPVEKPMELPAIGPVLFIDTAGVDDEGALGSLRVAKTRQVIERTDLALLIVEAGEWAGFEDSLLKELSAQNVPTVIVFNKSDLSEPPPALVERLNAETKTTSVIFSAKTGRGVNELLQSLVLCIPDEFINRPSIAADLVPEGRYAILVTPIDKAAPKGRLILPEVQTIRDLLDASRFVIVCRETGLPQALSKLNEKPAIVITDSQAFKTVNELTPPDIPLTGFSVLFARLQGDLYEMTRGALAIDRLKPGDKVLIAEACAHHPIHEDIGTIKIPRMLNRYVGGDLQFEWTHGRDFPENLASFKLIIHCGACTWNRRALLSRILRAKEAGVPITNYGLCIAYSLRIFDRALEPFPLAREIYRNHLLARQNTPRALMHTLDDIKDLLQSCENEDDFARLQTHALETTLRHVGPEIHFRGLIEFSNVCSRDCFYCGIRKSNKKVQRYSLSQEEIVELARWSAQEGYGSIALQSGERSDPAFVDFVTGVLRKIKSETRSELLPDGLGITLCVGEQTKETYQRFFDAGAHRYLLRIETTSPSLFARIHPSEQHLHTRLRALEYLKEIGCQVGTGVMIGLPGQTCEDLARDVLFFRDFDIDMIGMGPYLSHHDTPMSRYAEENNRNRLLIFRKSLAMIAAARIVCPKINIAATTALQTIDPAGRIDGLRFGANVLMPQTTPPGFRRNYLLYEGKPGLDENALETRLNLERQIEAIGRYVSKNKWGDSLRFHEKHPHSPDSPSGK